MKKNKLIAMAAACAITLTAFPLLVHGDDLPPHNSENDPLVSLSYINEVVTPAFDAKLSELATALEVLEEKIIDLELQNEALTTENNELKTELEALKENIAGLEGSGPSEQYEVVYLQKGAKLLASSPMEVILRSGTGIIVSITANGVNDITTGAELMNAKEVPLFHQLLVPRGNDGRGIQITSADAYVMVRGEYQIVQ